MLTYYGEGERIDLSGSVVARWLAKIANYLDLEGFSGPGNQVLVALPPHWRSVVWMCGTWLAGSCVTTDIPASEKPWPEVTVSNNQAILQESKSQVILAQTMPSLALRWSDELPTYALDALPELMAQADDLLGLPAASETDLALPQMTFEELNPNYELPQRVLVPNPNEISAARICWQAWSAGKSVVLVTDDTVNLQEVAQIEAATRWSNS